MKDVARRAQVSVGTVSNVLNRPDRVTTATRERVLRAIEELDFVRNEAARQLRAGHSRTVGLVVLDVANPFFTDLAAGVEQAAAPRGLSVVLCNSADDGQREQHYLSLLEEQRAYGVLITPVVAPNSLVDAIRGRGTPVVFVDRGSSRSQCSVSVDGVTGGELATSHLTQLGHDRLAFVGGSLTIPQVADRLKGARRALRKAKLPASRLRVIETGGLTFAEGQRAGAAIADLKAAERPTAVFCANDLLAIGLLQELIRRGLRIPKDISVVGYDDIEFAAAFAVALTSVRQPRTQLGRAAAELLIEEASDPANHEHRQVVFEPQLVVRESTAARG